MNPGLNSDHPSIQYYDGDYPSRSIGAHPDNFDEVTEDQGIAHDVSRFLELASCTSGPVLELCCGTGRVAIPLARAGVDVVGVDISSAMLAQCRVNLENEPEDVRRRVTLVEQDVTRLALPGRTFDLALIAFNSLLCIPEFEAQMDAISRTAEHLKPGGLLVIDIVNPIKLKSNGESTPRLFFTRKNPKTGNIYSRFSMCGPFDAHQRQELHGWYDEIEPSGGVKRKFYSMHWRPIFRFEIELMLRRGGLEMVSVEGGHHKEPFTSQSDHMFIQARKIGSSTSGTSA